MSNRNTSGGLGIFSVLTIIFIVLKLAKLVSWSWWVVFSPTLIWLAIVIVVLIYSFLTW